MASPPQPGRSGASAPRASQRVIPSGLGLFVAGELSPTKEVYSALLTTLSAELLIALRADPCPAARVFASQCLPRLRRAKGFLLASLRQPSRLVLLRCLGLRQGAPAAARRRWLEQLLAQLVWDGFDAGLLRGIQGELPVPAGTLVSERLNRTLQLPSGCVLRLGPESEGLQLHSLHGGSLPGPLDLAQLESPLGVAIAEDGPRFCFADTNPLSMEEAHPDKAGNGFHLGGKEPAEWVEAFRAAHGEIQRLLPEVAQEMELIPCQIHPVGYHTETHLSASYLEAPGKLYMSLHPNPLTLVEALIHEFQHTKLNLLLCLSPLFQNLDSPLYPSPLRPDPRPLRGVLLAVHAFWPVAEYYRRLLPELSGAKLRAVKRRYGQVIEKCQRGSETLVEHAQPVESGAGIMQDIVSFMDRFPAA